MDRSSQSSSLKVSPSILDAILQRNSRRHGMYFDKFPGIEVLEHAYGGKSVSDILGLSATSAHSSSGSSEFAESCTASQAIAAYYRAKYAAEETTDSYCDSDTSDGVSSHLPDTPPPLRFDTKTTYSQSREDGLALAYQEAIILMTSTGLTDGDRIACTRPGCNDVLKTQDDLVFHIHIHDIDDRTIVCSQCGGHYDSKPELEMHTCRPKCNQFRNSMYHALLKFSCILCQISAYDA